MTEAEKEANELIEKFKGFGYDDNGNTLIASKQISILCVDRIIKEMELICEDDNCMVHFLKFWQEVKQIITNK